MSLEMKVMEAMKEAMRSKDEGALRGIRAIKASIILAKTEKGSTGDINEEQEMKLLQKLMKQRKEAIEIFQKENRDDLVKKEVDEIAVIEKFLPKQMPAEELRKEIKEIIESTGAKSPQDMGKVMGVASKQFAGRADGKTISEIVKELLAPR